MNGKKAKRLRREAENLTVGKLSISYESDKPSGRYFIDEKGEKQVFEVSGSIRLKQGCTRQVYKQLKKNG